MNIFMEAITEKEANIIYYYVNDRPNARSISMILALKSNSPRNTRNNLVWTGRNEDP